MKKIKTLISIILAVVISVSAVIQSAAISASVACDFPVILISGDSVPIEDDNGNIVFNIGDLSLLTSGLLREGEDYTQMAFRILKDISLTYCKGCLTQDFTDYYQVIYDFFYPAFEKARLDENGNPQYGTNIRRSIAAAGDRNMNIDFKNYYTHQYQFYYDWRLDPIETADRLNEYIKTVKKTTGREKVGIICRCLGANVFLSYVSEYGMDDICGVGFDGIVVNGSEMLSETICGETEVNLDAINRVLIDLSAMGKAEIAPEITSGIDLVSRSGLFELVKFMIKFPNYNRLADGFTSAAALSTVFTWPNYWACVPPEKYETAVNTVFGAEGSELRTQYAGLIEKLDRYNEKVKKHIPELLAEVNSNANFAIISKYGVQAVPFTKSRNLVGDQYISAKRSSFGAATGTIYEPLSDDYVNNAIALGNEKYISPDRQIDASTCMFPDQTFFIKGSSHSDWTEPEMSLLSTIICADKQLTIDDLPDKHFMIYSYETSSAEMMTEENCHCENWEISHGETSYNPFIKIFDFCKSAAKLISLLTK